MKTEGVGGTQGWVGRAREVESVAGVGTRFVEGELWWSEISSQ